MSDIKTKEARSKLAKLLECGHCSDAGSLVAAPNDDMPNPEADFLCEDCHRVFDASDLA